MAQVLVRNLDRAVVERLRRRAEVRGRSLEAELRVVLTEAAGADAAARLAAIEAIRADIRRHQAAVGNPRGSDGPSASDSTELLRADRDR